MFKRIKVVFVVMIMLASACLAACGDSEMKKFAGTWVSTGPGTENVTVTFNEDGTMKWVSHSILGDAVTTGKFEPDTKEKYLTIYPDRDPDDKIGVSTNEWGFYYVVSKDYMTFYKMYQQEAVYNFKRQS